MHSFFFWEWDCIVLYFARYWITISTLISFTSIGSMSAKFAFKHILFLLLNGWILMWFKEFFNLILDYRWLLNRDWKAHVEHMWWEANNYIDILAKRGAFQFRREILYDRCLIFLCQCLYWDPMNFIPSRSCHKQ